METGIYRGNDICGVLCKGISARHWPKITENAKGWLFADLQSIFSHLQGFTATNVSFPEGG